MQEALKLEMAIVSNAEETVLQKGWLNGSVWKILFQLLNLMDALKTSIRYPGSYTSCKILLMIWFVDIIKSYDEITVGHRVVVGGDH